MLQQTVHSYQYLRILTPTSVAIVLFLAPLSLPAGDLNQRFKEAVQPLLSTYCFDCHSEDGAEADLSLEQFTSAAQVRDHRTTWLKVQSQLRAGSMPPSDADQPPPQQRNLLLDWIDQTINQADCSEPVDPGHVTLRRLNRNEYRNTVRDLLGVDYEPAADFPADDVGYGFDNIGDVMSLPPLLMEKYLTAAQQISQQAIVTPPPPVLQRTIHAKDLQGHGAPVGDIARSMASNGNAFMEVDFPDDGQYQIRVQAAGDQAGSEPVKMAIRIDDREVCVHDVRAKRDSPASYVVRVQVPAGKHKLGVAFTNDYYRPQEGDRAVEDRNLFVGDLAVRGPLGPATNDLPEAHRKIFVVQPDEKTSDAEAARQILTRLASAAFRRPAEPREIDRLLTLVELADQQGDSLETGIQLALQAILVSPHFLFRIERDPSQTDDYRQLNDFELATRLSYFLWSSMPDATLSELAGKGILRQGDNLEQQVRRMLQAPQSAAFVENFAGQWLQLRSLEDRAFDTKRFPGYNRELLAAMRNETKRFFDAIVHDDLSILRILDADFTFLNESLAKHYGIEGVEGDHFRQVSLQGTPRGGIMTQGSILAVTSNPTRTSPVKRGKFVLENLLGTPPPPPPANVPTLEEEGRQLTGTLRQRLEEHRSNPNCASCHKLMDPIGFALEHFDAVGRYRTEDDGAAIDSSGELPSGERFTGFGELRNLLLENKRDEFLQCMSEKMLVYAVGRGLEYYDQCAIDTIKNALEQDDYRFSRLVLEVVRSEPFQKQGKKRSHE